MSPARNIKGDSEWKGKSKSDKDKKGSEKISRNNNRMIIKSVREKNTVLFHSYVEFKKQTSKGQKDREANE